MYTSKVLFRAITKRGRRKYRCYFHSIPRPWKASFVNTRRKGSGITDGDEPNLIISPERHVLYEPVDLWYALLFIHYVV